MGASALHLFAGAGGGILGGLLVGHLPVCAVEIDPDCQRMLIARQQDGSLPSFPIWDDITTFDSIPWRGQIDVVHAGFPCQPWSFAGQWQGADDERNLWPDTWRVVSEVRPRYVLLENVAGLLATGYFRDTILRQITESGYDAIWATLGADDVGANHRRKRLWVLATDADVAWQSQRQRAECEKWGWTGNSGQKASDDTQPRCSNIQGQCAPSEASGRRQPPAATSRQPEPPLGRVVDGLADWLDATLAGQWWQDEPLVPRVVDRGEEDAAQLRALGNGQVPLCVATAWTLLMEASCQGW